MKRICLKSLFRKLGLLFLGGSLAFIMTAVGSKPVKAAGRRHGDFLNGFSVAAGWITCENREQSEDAAEQAMARLINRERAEAGLPELEQDKLLTGLAREKSRDMVERHYFGHLSGRLGSVYEQLRRNGVSYRIVAENLAGAPGYLRAHQMLMQSPAHRENLLNPRFTRIGIGIAPGGPYGAMITQILTD